VTTPDLARDFTNLLKSGQHDAAAAKYNAPDIVSYEAMDGPMAVCRGPEEIRKKGERWVENHEVHDMRIDGPYVNGDEFVVRFCFDVTIKQNGQRMMFDEAGVYRIVNGKIVSE
jgi:hypothetical protein